MGPDEFLSTVDDLTVRLGRSVAVAVPYIENILYAVEDVVNKDIKLLLDVLQAAINDANNIHTELCDAITEADMEADK